MFVRDKLTRNSNSFGSIDLPERPKNERGWVMFLGDFIAVGLAWYIANRIFFTFQIHTTFIGPGRIPVIEIVSLERMAVFGGLLLLFRQLGHYTDRIHYFFQLRSIFIACCLGVIAESLLRLYLAIPTSTPGIAIAWGLVVFIVMSLRILTANLVCSQSHFLQPAIVLSDGNLGTHARTAIGRKIRLGYRLIEGGEPGGNTDWISLAEQAIEKGDDAALANLKAKAGETSPNTLFLYAFDRFDQESVSRAISSLEVLGRPFGFVTSKTGIRLPSFKEFPFFGEDIILLLANQKKVPILSRLIKRSFDITLALLISVFLAPMLLVFTAMIARDGGPVVFSHARLGRDGKTFKCLKFRSMVADADARLAEHLDQNEQARHEWQETHKLKNDPRITAFGAFLRKSSLDEVAQLYNIIKGDMSFVGPRPIVQEEVAKYGSTFQGYCDVRPGITGLWQVSGRNNTSYAERVELDAWYVVNRSLWLDLFILVKTVPVVLLRRGAY